MTEKLTVYTTPNCQQCKATKRHLDGAGLTEGADYSVVDLTANPESYEHVVKLGHQKAPVVEYGLDHWSGFQPARLTAVVQALPVAV